MARYSRGRTVRNWIDFLEARLLLTGTFSNPEMAADWAIAGEDVGGNLILNNAGGITGGSETFSSGNTVAGNGTYSLAGVSGALTLTTAQYTRTGAVSSTRDVFTATDDVASFAMFVGIKHTVAFTAGDATGSWDFYTDASSTGGTGSGSLTLNAGTVTGKYKSTIGTKNVTGTYTIDASGNMTFALIVQSVPGTLNFTGAMNDSKDVVATSANNLGAVGVNPKMMVLTKRSGKYTTADVSGNWVVTTAGGAGTVVADGKGKVTGTITLRSGPAPISGTYTVASTGLITMHVKVVATRTFVYTLTASMNKNKNVIESVQAPASAGILTSENSLTIFTRAEDAAPTATKFTPPTVAMVGGVGKTFTSDQLLAMLDEGDVDKGDTVLVSTHGGQSVGIFVNGIQKFFDTTIFPGDTLTLVPNVQQPGQPIVHPVANFQVFDGSKYSNAVSLKIKDLPKPVITITAAPPKADEAKQIASKFTISRSGGDKTADLTVHYTIGGTAASDGSVYPVLTGTALIPAGQSKVVIMLLPVNDGKSDHDGQTVILTVVTDAAYTFKNPLVNPSATVTIVDANRPPTVTPFVAIAGTQNMPLTIPYADLVTATGALDPEATQMTFKLTGIVGTLTVNGTTAHGTATVALNDTVVWTPPQNKTGTLKMFSVAAIDLQGLSSVVETANALVT